jgi:hypothetical protein
MPKRSSGNRTGGNRTGGNRTGGNRTGGNRSGGNSVGGSSAAAFLRSLAPGTPNVNIQFDGGGVGGVFVGTFQGTDGRGNFLFTNLASRTTNVVFPGLTRIAADQIHAASI